MIRNLAEYRKTNVEATLKIADWAHLMGVKRFIFLSSVKAAGESTTLGLPLTENQVDCPEIIMGLQN